MSSIYQKVAVSSPDFWSMGFEPARYKYFLGDNPVSPDFVEAKIYHNRYCLYASGLTPNEYGGEFFDGYGMYDLRKREPVIPGVFNSMAYDSVTGLVICQDIWYDGNKQESESWVYGLDGNCILHGDFDIIKIIGKRYIHVGRKGKNGLYTVGGKLLRNVYYDSISVVDGNRFYTKGRKILNKPVGKEVSEFTGKLINQYFHTDFSHTEECFAPKRDQTYEFELYSRDESEMAKYAIIEQHGKKGLLKITGELLVPIEYDQIDPRHNRIVCFRGNQSFSYVEEDFPIKTICVQKEKETQSVLNNSKVHYVFFDTETTGVTKNNKAPTTETENWPRLVQLSWIVHDMDGNELSKGNYIIRPNGFLIPDEAAKVHGITNKRAMLEGVSLQKAMDKFLAVAKDAEVLIGHNVGFDMGVVGCESVRLYGKDLLKAKTTVDTMLKSIDFCALPSKYGYKWPKLQELHKMLFGYEFDDAHDSSADVAATADCYWKLVELGVIDRL